MSLGVLYQWIYYHPPHAEHCARYTSRVAHLASECFLIGDWSFSSPLCTPSRDVQRTQCLYGGVDLAMCLVTHCRI